jgi:hypothetical protein
MIDSNTLLYLRGDSYNDLSLNPMTFTHTADTANIYLENNKIRFNNPGETFKLQTSSTIAGDFTFEWWCNIESIVGYNMFTNRATPGCFIISHRTADVDYLATWMGTAADNWNVISWHQFGVPTYNTDVHYAYVRKGNQYYTFVNGQIVSQITGGALTLGLNNVGIGASSIQKAWNIRISNVARWDSNFIPPTRPYTSVIVEIIDQSNPSNISFKAKKASPNETINKVEVLLNGALINTYTNNYDEITCSIDESSYITGENNIEIRAYYFENYYVSQTVTRIKTIEKLNANPELSELINKLTEIKTFDSSINSKIFNFLTNKNIEVTEEKTISNLITKMQDYADGANSELTNLINEIASLESNKSELNNQIASLSSQISTLNGQVSSLNSQKTSLSSQVTTLNNTNTENKSILVSTLNSFGATGITTSSDIGTITTKIYDLYSKAVTASSYISYSVSIPSGTPYGFTKNNGWFESYNKGVHSSYALCKVTITGSTSYTKYIDYISYAESNYDYGIVSTLNKTLTSSATADTSNVLFNTKGKASSGVKTYKLGTSNGYYYVKFIKDSSGNSYNDSFKFKIRGV